MPGISANTFVRFSLSLVVFSSVVSCTGKFTPEIGEGQLCLADKSGRLHANAELPLVREALARLGAIEPDTSIGILSDNRGARKIAGEARPAAFLAGVCDQYRDRGDIIEERLRAFAALLVVPDGHQAYRRGDTVWRQLTADGYEQLVLLTQAISIFAGRHSTDGSKESLQLSDCDYRFIFERYIAEGRRIYTPEDFESFERERKTFLLSAVQSGACTRKEIDDVILFRGEGLQWPTSAEANSMRAIENYFSGGCRNKETQLSEERCREYRSTPFAVRMKFSEAAARALVSLAASHPQVVGKKDKHVILIDDRNGDGLPDGLTFDKRYPDGTHIWNAYQSTIVAFMQLRWQLFDTERKKLVELLSGYEQVLGRGIELMLSDADLSDLAPLSEDERMKRLATVFLRHVDYYKIGYFFGRTKLFFSFFSPWISTSPYLSEAHKFTFKSYALAGPRERRMSWIQIFRVPRSQLFTKKVGARAPSLDRDWFDESSIVPASSLKELGAVEKLGRPDPAHFGELLWLGRVEPTNALLDLARYGVFVK